MILVVEHKLDWAKSFEKAAEQISLVLGGIVVDVHHIGSTAISTTKAKPVIDMLLEVTSLESLDELSPFLEELGYEGKGEFGVSGRRYFRLNNEIGQRTHQIHAFEAGVHNVIRHIAFRDYMRAHRSIAFEYGELKERLARENPNDMEAYISGKDPFIKEHERQALLWKELIQSCISRGQST